jgi:hypothetical protein
MFQTLRSKPFASADNVVGLVTRHVQSLDIHRGEQSLDQRNLHNDILGNFVALSFVSRKVRVSLSRFGCIEGNREMSRLLFVENIQHRVCDAEDSVRTDSA